MRIYLALGGGTSYIKSLSRKRAPWLLCSFEYRDRLQKLTYRPESMMIDSGAFTAWSQGREVKLDDYRRFCDTIRDTYKGTLYVNLDVIPGTPGTDSTEAERKAAAEESLHNADVLRSDGLPVMEVFHQDEDWDFLGTLLDRLPDEGILGISPRNDVMLSRKIDWLESLLGVLLGRFEYTPSTLPRMHILGATATRILHAFPAYSLDSSTWVNPGRYGRYIDEDGTQTELTEDLPHSHGQVAADYGVRKSLDNYRRLEQRMTNLWAHRGVSFDAPATA